MSRLSERVGALSAQLESKNRDRPRVDVTNKSVRHIEVMINNAFEYLPIIRKPRSSNTDNTDNTTQHIFNMSTESRSLEQEL